MKSTRLLRLNRCPTHQKWSDALEQEEFPASWADHLGDCMECQSLLDEMAAPSQLWAETSETLSEQMDAVTHIVDSIVPLSLDSTPVLVSSALCSHELNQLQKLLSERSSVVNGTQASLRHLANTEPIATLGRYELEQLIGRGGMGLVFRAWDTELHRVVAVKTLGMSLWSIPSARQRFVREGRAAALLNHPHIVPLYDVITESPVPALVMQYIAGPTLDQWVKQHGPMPWQEALKIGWQLADALSAAHRESLVHRDIKPGNVLLEADGSRALLTDFGLVRAADDATLTLSGSLAGTPHFMSPEQARGEDVDGRSDLFSLGALLYFAIAGQPPFNGRESMAVLNALCHRRHQSLAQLNPQVPKKVSRLIDELLSKSAHDRPASSGQVRDRLRALIDSPPVVRQKKLWLTTSRLALLACALGCVAITVNFIQVDWGIQPATGDALLAAHQSPPLVAAPTQVAPETSAANQASMAAPELDSQVESFSSELKWLEQQLDWCLMPEVPTLPRESDYQLEVKHLEREIDAIRDDMLRQ